ncbi:MAG TPA: pilus assembly protein N-terminal domain-containing protein [Bryobacteraceae bacterium]|nr:pilus assembly protein N-terminal domain-containing protein [Bryobacteraceae bacterium]
MTCRNRLQEVWRRAPAICLALWCGLGSGALRAQTEQAPGALVLTVGKSLIVPSDTPIERIAVGFGDVAEARAVTPREILLDGKAPGETSLIVWQRNGQKLFFNVSVQPNTSNRNARLAAARRQLQEQLPGQDIQFTLENDYAFLTGTAADLVSVERAIAIAGSLGKVVNLLYVTVPPADKQVLLKVQFATVDRNASTELGLNLLSTGAGNTIGRVTTGQFSPPIPKMTPGEATSLSLADALNVFLFRPDLNLAATLRALQARGLFEVLAEPNVLAMHGKPASFLAGGEFPYPILQGGGAGLGAVTIAFREFGVRINFLPVVTPRGTIRLQVAPEVSALDFTSGLTVQGFTIPALTTRRVQTEIELQTGQSFAIGGLLDRRLTETIQKVPLLAAVPLLGSLFQSRALQQQRNELIVIVTPEIVQPVPEGGSLPGLNLPKPLMGPDALTPGTASFSPAPPPQPPDGRIPFERLLQSMKEEQAMKLETANQSTTWPGAQPLDFATNVPAAPLPGPAK